jgi:Xaa-Pro aminopeptidase
MQRREFLQAGAGIAGGAALAPAAAAAGKGGTRGSSVPITTRYVDDPSLGRRIPLNRERARQVMEELGIDGLVAAYTHNVYYLSNTITTLTRFGAEFPAFATFARDPSQPSFLLTSTGNTWETANGEREVPEIIAMSGALNWQDYVNASPEKMRIEPVSAGTVSKGQGIKEGGPFTARELAWKHAQETYLPDSAPTPAWALQRALKRSGLLKGRIAVDDMRIAWLLQSIGVDTVTILPGDNVFRRIRVVKTPDELALMRVAQEITQHSAEAMVRALEPGMTFEQARTRFFAESAARGAEPGFLLLGITQGLLPDGVVQKGRSYMLDCSAHFKQYQGDFARTVMIGEPAGENLRRFRAQQEGRHAAFEIIKAGVSFREVERVAREALIKAGMPKNVPVVALHSVGLQHGDDPARLDVPFDVRAESVLEENMVVTLDLPFIEIGTGAGHNEDMLRITRNGYELMNDPRDPLLLV